MPPTTGEASATELRLASARRRLRAFIAQIDELQASDFPHDDGREALDIIKQHCLIRQNMFALLPPTVVEDVVHEICSNTSVFVSRYTGVLGFILRSTNVRNAFEVHFPLKRLVEQIISADARLIMSSEWNFVPFTYPMNLDLLSNFVMVGGPAPESGNVLIVPLAGHEIGHSAWRHHDIKDRIQPDLTSAIDQVIDADPISRDRILADLQQTGLDLSYLQNACLFSGIRQLEEVFCDLFGLYVFGESYLYAYEYFLAPGGGSRAVGYPSAVDRLRYVQEGAQALGVTAAPSLFDGWQDSSVRAGLDMEVLALADRAVSQTVPALRDITFELLRSRQVPLNRPDAVIRVMEAFAAHVPDGEGATLPEIVSAGWRYLREAGGLSADADRPEHDMLGELILKSIEVSEFLLRVSANA